MRSVRICLRLFISRLNVWYDSNSARRRRKDRELAHRMRIPAFNWFVTAAAKQEKAKSRFYCFVFFFLSFVRSSSARRQRSSDKWLILPTRRMCRDVVKDFHSSAHFSKLIFLQQRKWFIVVFKCSRERIRTLKIEKNWNFLVHFPLSI